MSGLNKTQQIAKLICKKRGHKVNVEWVMNKTEFDHKTTIRILRKFQKKEFLKMTGEKVKPSRPWCKNLPKRFPVWEVIDRNGICNFTECPGRNGKGQVRDKIWKAIRIKRIFTLKDIHELTDVAEDVIGDYLRILKSSNLVRQTGRTGLYKNWQLVMVTPPVKRPNLKEAS